MDDVDLGAPQPLRDEATDSSGSHSDDEYDHSHDDHEPLAPSSEGGLSQRLRGTLQRRVTPLVGNLRHSIATSTGVDATTSRLRSAMQRIRGRDDGRADGHLNQTDTDRADDGDQDHFVLSKPGSAVLRASLASAGLSLVDEDKLILLGHTPLVQPQDSTLFLERPSTPASTVWTLKRGDFVRVQCPDDRTQSWLCQIASEKSSADADVLELLAPFPGPLLPDAVVHYVPHECLPSQVTAPADDDAVALSDEEDNVPALRSSLETWRPSLDDADVSTDDETAAAHSYASVTSRTSVARDKAAAFYETLKTRKARLRTSSADYKDKLKQASQVSKEKLAVASQISKEKLAVASQASKEKLAVASVVSKEKLAVASQVSKEKLAVAGHASKLKMQLWTTSAKSSFKAKMAQRAEQKAAAAAATAADASVDNQVGEGPDVFTIEDSTDDDELPAKPARRVADIDTEEQQLRRELDDC